MEQRAAHSVWRMAAVAFIALVAALTVLPDVALPWHPFSGFGMQFDGAGNVIGVQPGRPADRAGIRKGDRFDIAAMPIESRRYLDTGFSGAADGTRADFVVRRGSSERDVSVTANVHPRTLFDNITDEILMLAAAAFIVISSVLVLLRPSKMMWAFFIYGSFGGVGASVLALALAPLWAYVLFVLIIQPINSLAWIAFAIFALRFPNDSVAGWQVTAQRALLLALIPLIPLTIWTSAGALFALPPPDLALDLQGLLTVAGFVFVALTFALTYAGASAVDRPRLRWVMVGMLIGEAGILVYEIATSIPGVAVALPIPAINILTSLQIAVPLTVAYAVIKHRVFDVRFVIGRAVVYGLLTTALLVGIALLDFLIGRVLSETHIATIVEALAAVAIGLSLNTLHRWLEGLVDATLFRSRRRAEQRLRRIARGLVHADSAAAVTRVLVAEPYDAYTLASSALFRRGENGFARDETIGWKDAELRTINRDASIVLQLQAVRRPVAAHDAAWQPADLPPGLAYPAVVLPVFVRDVLDALVFYGPHASGEDLDPEEIGVLEELTLAAAAAYDHAAAELALARMTLLEAEVTSLRGLIAPQSASALLAPP
jgi:hypothetical protein